MQRLKFQTRQGGIPILSNNRIEEDAEFFLFEYDPSLLSDPHPLDVEDITERYFGFNIHYECLSNNGCIWGRMIFNNRRIIVYDPDADDIAYCPIDENTVVIDNSLLDPAREYAFRSTMIHECGHGIYHTQIYKEDDAQLSLFPENNEERLAVTVCRSTDIQEGDGKRSLVTDHDWVEHHAKYFSAAMLMPRRAMQIVCGEEKVRKELERLTPDKALKVLASTVSETFNVSPASARIRISQLGYDFEEKKQRSLFTAYYNNKITMK